MGKMKTMYALAALALTAEVMGGTAYLVAWDIKTFRADVQKEYKRAVELIVYHFKELGCPTGPVAQKALFDVKDPSGLWHENKAMCVTVWSEEDGWIGARGCLQDPKDSILKRSMNNFMRGTARFEKLRFERFGCAQKQP